MEITKRLSQGVYDITLKGKFIFPDHPEFREILGKISDHEVQKIIFHMQEVECVDSAALGMLLLAHDEATNHKKQIVISGATGAVKKMFDMARFDTFFSMI